MGQNVLIKIVKKFGNGAHIIINKSMLGKTVEIKEVEKKMVKCPKCNSTHVKVTENKDTDNATIDVSYFCYDCQNTDNSELN